MGFRRIVLMAAVVPTLLAACQGELRCIRGVRCVRVCGGEAVAIGCECPEGTFDDWDCPGDAGTEDAGGRNR